jgi:RNA polymerase sigma-70 factor (ECF subfamily)
MNRTVIEGVAAGDREVFLSFYSRISAPFMKFIYFRAGGDSALAEDVFQEALTRYREVGTRKRKVISLDSLDTVVQEALLQVESRQVAPEAAAHPQMRMLVGMVLTALRPEHAEALKAKYCEGLSVDEIAARLGDTAKAVEGRLYRAREAFREVFLKVRREIESPDAC